MNSLLIHDNLYRKKIEYTRRDNPFFRRNFSYFTN